MLGKVKKIKDTSTNNDIIPITHAAAVYLGPSTTLAQRLQPDWAGKTWNAVGDSITSGGGTTKIYHEYVKEMLGFATVNNLGVSGTNLSNSGPNAATAMCLRVKSMAVADLITIFGGTNDYGNAPVPLLGAITDTVDTTIYGGLHSICQTLITSYPSAKHVLFTPLQRADTSFGGVTATTCVIKAGNGANAQGVTVKNIADVVLEVGAYYSIPVLDLYRHGNIQPSFSAHSTTFMPDYLHPNAAGHGRIATIIAQFLATL